LVPEAVATRPQQQAIYLREVASLLAIYEKVYGGSPLANATVNGQGSPTKLTSIDGWEVVYIDGIYAIPLLWSIATDQATSFRVGVTKDAHTRFNLLTSGFTYDVDGPPGYFGYRSLRSYGIPDKSSVTLTVRDPSDQTMYDIVFKWVGIAPTPPALRGGELEAQQFQADPSLKGRLALAGEAFPAFPLAEPLHENPILQGQQLEAHYWSIMTAQHPAAESERIALGLPPVVSSEPASVSAPALSEAQQEAGSAAPAVRANGISLEIPREISFKTLDDGTGVLRINTFSPKSIEAFLDLLQQGVTTHQQYGGKRLIIDLRANGGGDICLGYAVLRFLFPQLESELFSDAVAGDAPFGRYDIPLSPATRKLAELGLQNQKAFPLNNTCEFMTPCAWVRADTQTVFTDFTWSVAIHHAYAQHRT
jgi:hypothetical protein